MDQAQHSYGYLSTVLSNVKPHRDTDLVGVVQHECDYLRTFVFNLNSLYSITTCLHLICNPRSPKFRISRTHTRR